LKLPLVTGAGIAPAAPSSNVTFRPVTPLLPPALAQSTRLVPVGPVSKTSRSLGKACVKLFSVTLTFDTIPARLVTNTRDG